ncbi:MAG TPA: efflux RND transporter periplasmic adaptor subunit [Vicinamibacterales bacterium]|jgi:RND family efflux transporter MFP subunit|nr:efflux RND transporter periplasmic adaptor subunit [Vicinamibacterales bacterium]
MTDLKQDLAALRIEREPDRPSAARWIVWVGALIVLATASVAAWRWATRERAIEVQAATVTERAAGTQAAVLNASGYVTARRRATVSSKVTGKVIEVNVEEGRAVTQGEVLARLDDSTERAALALVTAQAEAARRAVAENEVHLAQARTTLARVAKLRKDGLITDADVDTAKADVDGTDARINALNQAINVAERQIDVQKTDLDNTVIRAPFSGVAISKDAQPGEMVSPVSAGGGFTRTGICTIVDMRSLEIEVDVNESYINRVRSAQHVTAVLDAYPDWQIPAHVIAVVPTADRQKATVLVRIGFEALDPRILPDMGVKVTFLRDPDQEAAPAAQPTTLAPKAAVAADNGNNFVFVVSGDSVERRAVKVGGSDGDRVEVLAGLRPGDRVVVSPPPDLKDGAKVMVK